MDNDEAKVLAALGGTAESASVYEESVLQTRRLEGAPVIALPHAAIANNIASRVSTSSAHSLVPCGEAPPTLPDVSTLTTSKSSLDAPQVLKVLSKTRGELHSAVTKFEADEGERRKRVDVLRMKEQILLKYLTEVANMNIEDVPRSKVGRKRRRSLDTAAAADGSASTSYYGNPLEEAQHGAADGGRKRSSEKLKSTSLAPPTTNRLDRIKNGEMLGAKKPRQTMMSIKNQMRQDSGLAPLKSMEEERFDADKARARREERRARRRKRLRAALGIDSSDEDAEFDGKTKKKDAKKMPSILGKKGKKGPRRTTGRVRFDDDSAAVAQAVKTERNYTKVFCPICQTILTVNDNDDGTPDEVLARHIQSCQASSRTRNGSRTLRKRRKPSVVDLDSDEDSDIEAEVLAESGDLEDTKNSRIPTRLEAPTSIDDLDEFDYEDRIDFWVANGLGLMGSMSERDKSEVPPGSVVYDEQLEVPAWMNDRLFPYQRTGVRWMWELYRQGAGGVVGDEMGLGKTVQVCSFLGSMCSNRMLGSVLIVAPATMLTHWLRELAVWAPGLRRVIVHKSGEADGVARVVSKGMLRSLQRWLKKAREDRVNEPIDEDDFRNPSNPEHMFCGVGYAVVTTYDNIRRSQDEWTGHNWSYVVLDEGQKIRNPDSEVTLACKRLRTPNRLLLSGTPIQNDLKELWSLFDFIFPGRLGTLPAFEAEFAAPIKRGGYSNASPMQVQLAYRCSLVLRDLINPYLLRRQKKDIKEVSRMPGKTEQVLFCRLTSKQRSLYEDYIRSDEVLSVVRGNTQLLKAVTVLRKICNHPDLISGPNGADFNGGESSSDSEDEDYMDMERLAERSGKLQVLAKILHLWKEQGHNKVIIFTQWRKMLTIIEQFVGQNEWRYARLDGNTNIASRQKLVDKFNNDESYFCFLMTTKTGGVGLNVTGANRVILYDPDWNPQTDAQARERAWRFGQNRDVTVYRLISAGTIEEKIYQRQIFKTAITNQVLQDPKQRRLFSQKDLKDLFTLKADSKEVTETGELTRGRGVVNMNIEERKSAGDGNIVDNTDTLGAVMKSKGLCGVFDHDFVENTSKKKSLSVIEMEENATKVAMNAAAALQKSLENQSKFQPTFTGSEETRPSFSGNRMASSNSLLANLKGKRIEIANASKPPPRHQLSNAPAVLSDDKYAHLLQRIQKFIRCKAAAGKAPSTRELLNAFKDVPDSDAAVFRNLLKSVASINNGHWTLKK